MLRLLVCVVLASIGLSSSVASPLQQTVLKPGDEVTLTCTEEPKLDGSYQITATGLILLPFVGAVDIAGLTEDAAGKKVSDVLVRQQILRAATVSIKVKAPPVQQPLPIQVTGAVAKATDVPYRDSLRLADALAAAEPLSVADLAAIRITSVTGESVTVNHKPWIASQDEAANPKLNAGDKVFVPIQVASQEVTVLGAVKNPGVVQWSEGMTVRSAIELAGGFRRDANQRAVELTTTGGNLVTLDMTATVPDRPVMPGEKIFVPVREITDNVYIRGAVTRPGLIPFVPGLTVGQVVQDAGPIKDARLDKVKIYRKRIDEDTRVLTVNVVKILGGSEPDVELVATDIVEVPYPSRSFKVDNTVKIVGAAILVYFIFFR